MRLIVSFIQSVIRSVASESTIEQLSSRRYIEPRMTTETRTAASSIIIIASLVLRRIGGRCTSR